MKTKLILILTIYVGISSLYSQECITDLMQNPSEDVVPKSLIDDWKTAGTNTNFSEELVLNVFNSHVSTSSTIPSAVDPQPIGFRTYKVDVARLNATISAMSLKATTNKKYVLYFPIGTYVYGISDTKINMRPNVILRGEGKGTTFAISNLSTNPVFTEFNTFLTLIDMTDIQSSGIECLSITTLGLFAPRFSVTDDIPTLSYLINKSIIRVSNSTNCWIKGVDISGGFGSTIDIHGSLNIKVHGCRLNYAWVHCGSGGTQGYGINLVNSHKCLIENNEIGDMRHAIVIQYGSSKNVVSYNYCHDSWCCSCWSYYDIALHGRTANDQVICADKELGVSYNLIESNYSNEGIRIDNEHGSNGLHNVLYRNYSEDEIAIEERGWFQPNCDIVNSKNYQIENIGDLQITATGTYRVERESTTTLSAFNPNTGSYDPIYTSLPARELGRSCYLNDQPDWLGSLPKFGFGNCGNLQSVPMQGWWPYIPCGSGVSSNNVPIQVETLGLINCDMATGDLGTIRVLNVSGGVAPFTVTMSMNGQFLNVRTIQWPNNSFEADFFGHNRPVLITIVDAVGNTFTQTIFTRCSNRFGTGDFMGNGGNTDESLDNLSGSGIDNKSSVKQQNQYLSISSFAKPIAFPNPFNNKTIVRYSCLEEQHVTIKLFNTTGQYIRGTSSSLKGKGVHEFEIERQDLPTGIYFCHILVGKKNHILRLVIE